MDIIISVLSAEAIPAGVLYHALRATGLHGGARYTTAFSALGPGGIAGGLATLAVIQALSFVLSEEVIKYLYLCVIQQLYKEGMQLKEISNIIDSYPISKEMKDSLKKMCRCDYI